MTPLNIHRLLLGGSIIPLPVNCWFSRALRMFRREGRLTP